MDYIHRGDRVKRNKDGRMGTVKDIYFGRYAPTVPMFEVTPDDPREFNFSGCAEDFTKI